MNTNDPKSTTQDDDLLPDYSGLLKNGVHGKYAGRIRRKANLAVPAPDVAEAFPTDQAVNAALRSLIARRDKEPSTEPAS